MGELANTWFYAGNLAASDSLNRILLDMDKDAVRTAPPLGGRRSDQPRGDPVPARELRGCRALLSGGAGHPHSPTTARTTRRRRRTSRCWAAPSSIRARHEEAMQALHRALAIQERVFGPVHPAVASTLNDLGVAAMQTEDMPAAEEDYRRMLSIYDVRLRAQALPLCPGAGEPGERVRGRGAVERRRGALPQGGRALRGDPAGRDTSTRRSRASSSGTCWRRRVGGRRRRSPWSRATTPCPRRRARR